jgi:pyridoxamine 5'-phosphate oxidase-like protein
VKLPATAKRVVESQVVATLVTLNEDGSPNVTMAWVGLEGDEVVIGTLPEQGKLRNMRRELKSPSASRPAASTSTGLRSTSCCTDGPE